MTVRSRRLVYGGAACISFCVGWVVLQGWSVPAELPRDREGASTGVGAAAKASPAPSLALAGSSGSTGSEVAESSSSSEAATDTVAPSKARRAAGTALPAVPRIGCGEGGYVGSLSGKEYCRLLDEALWAEIDGDDASSAAADRPRRLLASQALKRLLKKQHRLHRLVAEGREPEGQRYLVWSLSGGVGNRMESLVSTFLAAMLSGRVLLVKDWFAKTQKKGKPMPKEYHNGMLLEVLEAAAAAGGVPHNSEILCESLPMMHLRDFRAAYPHYFAAEARKEHIKVDIVGKHDKHYTKWSKLACAHPTEFPSPDVKFTYLWTNQYYLPLFWANPTVRGTMQELFPDGDGFGPLSRFLLRPNQVVEAVVEKFVCAHAQKKPGGAARAGGFLTRQDPSFTNLVGLQMRAFRPNKMVEMAKDFDACLARQPGREAQQREAATYFVASLHKPMRDYFTKKYRGRVVALDAEARGEQETGSVSGDVEALANILILGRTADFLVSPGSTFGSFAAGYYSRLPVQMHTMGSGGACTRLASPDPCFISWLRVDKLLQRMSDAAGPFPCRPEPVPEAATANCAAHLSVPFKK